MTDFREEAQQKAAIDPFYDMVPEKMWIGITNIGVKAEGMVRIILEVNGKERELYHSYVHDGTISDWHNLTRWLKRDQHHCFSERCEVERKEMKQQLAERDAEIAKLQEAVKWYKAAHELFSKHAGKGGGVK